MLVRKTVTVLFCDVTESTRLGESLDPETHRRVMSRYFEEMSAALEAHGGTVEKFIGDAVMAVFGVPTVHEDDALRAVRAAAEMRERLRDLNEELEPAYGVRLEMRTGVNTGEVVAGDTDSGHTLVTGDAVVVAKRLEEAAPPGQILIGKATYPLVLDAIDAGPLQTFSAKGKRERVPSRRLDEVRAGEAGIARRFDAPLVGREAELSLLENELLRAESERNCRLLTVLGPAGIGKSRLARELLAAAGDRATTLTGRCLPYGEGITFWPLVDIVRAAGGEDAVREVLGDGEQGLLAAERLLAGIGKGLTPAPAEETFWGVRRYLEALARERPVVLCLEDLQWAEPTLLDLVDYLTGWVHDSPLVILCLARPDLLERRPAWSAPRENVSILLLEPLSETASAALLAGLGPSSAVGAATQLRIAEAAEGNPLFLEQLSAMAAESGDGTALPVPPSVQAVIAERLDRLDADERAVVECASVVGKEFPRGAVVDLAPPETKDAIGHALRSLVRKGLVRPDFSGPGREDGFRFDHVLIRDVAYEAMPKQLRAELHERFPDWIRANAGERAGELEEIVAYHLEQAYRYRTELGPPDDRVRALGQQAAELLGRAGRRALSREDVPAAVNLLERSRALGVRADPELTRDLGSALWAVGDASRAEALLEEVVERAQEAGDTRLEWYARLDLASHTSVTAGTGGLEEIARKAVAVFTELDDDAGLAQAWRRLAIVSRTQGRFGRSEEESRRGLEHAHRAGDGRERARLTDRLCTALLYGPAPVGRATEECERLLTEAHGLPVVEAGVEAALAGLRAMEGRFEEARDLYKHARRTYEELGNRLAVAGLTEVAGSVELAADDPRAAELELRAGLEILVQAGHRHDYAQALLAEALLAQERVDEARDLVGGATGSAAEGGSVANAALHSVRARIAGRSAPEDGLGLAHKAVEAAQECDSPVLVGDAFFALAEVLTRAGRPEDALEAAQTALAAYERKEDRVSAARLRRLLAQPVS